MMTASEALSELQRIGRAFSVLSSLEGVVEVAAVAESRVASAEKSLADAAKALADLELKHEARVKALEAEIAERSAKAEAAEKFAADEHAALKAEYADELKKAKDKLADIKEATDDAVKLYDTKHTDATKKLADLEAAAAAAAKKLEDINAAIAAIAGR